MSKYAKHGLINMWFCILYWEIFGLILLIIWHFFMDLRRSESDLEVKMDVDGRNEPLCSDL